MTTSASPHPPTFHALVVDDDEMVLASVGSRFEAAGFTVTSAMSYTAALDAFAANRHVDVLVTDYNLSPTETGVRLALVLRKIKPDLPVVVFSGNTVAVTEDALVPGAVIVSKAAGLAHVVKAAQQLLADRATNA